MKKLLTVGNQKVGKDVLIFSLPPLKTCTPTKWCREHCYALKNRFVWKTVRESLNWKFEESKKENFVKRVNNEIKKSKKKYVRIHASGDFYNIKYVNKWIEIVKNNPDKLFLAFTKREDLKDVLRKLEALPNMQLYGSLDESKLKTSFKKWAAIEGTKVSEKYRTCNMGCKKCGYKCWHDPRNVMLHEH